MCTSEFVSPGLNRARKCDKTRLETEEEGEGEERKEGGACVLAAAGPKGTPQYEVSGRWCTPRDTKIAVLSPAEFES